MSIIKLTITQLLGASVQTKYILIHIWAGKTLTMKFILMKKNCLFAIDINCVQKN